MDASARAADNAGIYSSSTFPSPPRLRALSVFALFLALALLVRVPGFWVDGTTDTGEFALWARHAVADGVVHLYGSVFHARGYWSIVDYPPMALYELAAAGHLRSAFLSHMPGIRGDIYAVKLLAVGASAAVGVLLWWIAHRRMGQARRATVLYWANPAAVLHTSFLGYVGTLAAVPALLALVAVESGWAASGGALLAAGMLTKPQAMFAAPGMLVLLRGRRDAWLALAGAALASLAIMAPMVLAGATARMTRALIGLISEGTFSAQGANVWWIVSYLVAVAQRRSAGDPAPWLARARILAITDALGAKTELLVVAAAWTAVLLVVGWAVWRVRARRSLPAAAAVSALSVHAYFLLAVQVHENHLFLALPLLALVGAFDRRYLGVLVAVSAFAALNLNLFYGLTGSGGYALPRELAGIDTTVLLAAAGLVVFAGHVRVFARRPGASSEPDRDTRAHLVDAVRPVGVQ
jgi:hypothetical protein